MYHASLGPLRLAERADNARLVSNDGIHFREPVKGHVYISRHESPVTQPEGKEYHTVLCQYNGILNVGDETRIYHGRWRNTVIAADYYAEVALATLPRDRWGALGLFSGEAEGWVWSAPVTIPDGVPTLRLNADHPEQMREEVSDEQFNLLPECSGSHSGLPSAGDPLDSLVTWPDGDLSALRGRSVRFKVNVRRDGSREPRRYALYVHPL